MRTLATAALAATLATAGASPAAAQIDYRNLDDGRPVPTEDAYAIERYAFEVLVPYELETGKGGRIHLFAPELSYGILPNAQLGLKLPLAAVSAGGETAWGLAGPRLFALYNFNTESAGLPALAVRADVAVPAGRFGGEATRTMLKAIATRSWGRTRAHLNAGVTLGDPAVGAAHPLPDWMASLAVDRTLLRQSTLLIGSVTVAKEEPGLPSGVAGALGLRYQLTPTLVVDAGIRRRLTRAGPDLGLTVGLSHVFALPGLMPARSGRIP